MSNILMGLEDVEDGVPELEGWMSLPAAEGVLHVSRQYLFQLKQAGRLTSIRKIRGKDPEPGQRKRPALYVISTAEVEGLLSRQQAAAAEARPEPVAVGQ